jgi:hypothetical protein
MPEYHHRQILRVASQIGGYLILQHVKNTTGMDQSMGHIGWSFQSGVFIVTANWRHLLILSLDLLSQ